MEMPAATCLDLLAIIFRIDYRKKNESQESHFKDAVGVCLPLINATIRDIAKGVFPKDCSLNIEIPTSPSSNKVCILNITRLRNRYLVRFLYAKNMIYACNGYYIL